MYHMMALQLTYHTHIQQIHHNIIYINNHTCRINKNNQSQQNQNYNSLSFMINSKLIITDLFIILTLNNTQVKQWLM